MIAEERQLDANPPTNPGKPAIVVKDTDFAWDPKVRRFLDEEPMSKCKACRLLRI